MQEDTPYTPQGVCIPNNRDLNAPLPISPGISSLPYYLADPPESSLPIVNTNTTTFTWSKPRWGVVSRYALYVRDLNTGNLIINEESLATTSFSYNYLSSNTKYKWNVRAIDKNNKGGWLSDGYYFQTSANVGRVVDPKYKGLTNIEIVDEDGLPIPQSTIAYSCYDPIGNFCSKSVNLQGVTITGLDGKVHWDTGYFGSTPGINLNITWGGFSATSTIVFSALNPSQIKMTGAKRILFPTVTLFTYTSSAESTTMTVNGIQKTLTACGISSDATTIAVASTVVGAPFAIPVSFVGAACDLSNGTIYSMRGDYLNAAFSTASIVPLVGLTGHVGGTIIKLTLAEQKVVARELALGADITVLAGRTEKITSLALCDIITLSETNISDCGIKVTQTLLGYNVWMEKYFKRGNIIDQVFNNAGKYTKTIDVYDEILKKVTSVKSLDIALDSYQDVAKLKSRLKEYTDTLANYTQGRYIKPDLQPGVLLPTDIASRELLIALPDTLITPAQLQTIKDIAIYAKSKNVDLTITIIK